MPEKTPTVKVRRLDARARLPIYASSEAAGADLSALLDEELVLNPLDRALVPTGLSVEIPNGFEGQVRPRSGLAVKQGITVLNAPGTVDSDYRGEIRVALVNLGSEPFTIHDGDRIAQLVIAPCVQVDFHESDELALSIRGEAGFGSTGHR
jgi:dUTP pyrophosphatase